MDVKITNSEAREIASLWQSPGVQGIGFAQFASTSTVTDDLLEGIDRELAYSEDNGHEDDAAALRALRDYVNAESVTVWTVGHNIAGYLPESEVFYTLTYADAVTAYVDDINEAADDMECECDEVGCTCEDRIAALARGESIVVWHGSECPRSDVESTPAELCEACGIDAYVKAYVADDVPSVVGSRVFGQVRDLLIGISPESASLPTFYWVTGVSMTVEHYREETADV